MTSAVLRCPKHPEYKAKFKPRCICNACWGIWTLVSILRAYVYAEVS